MMKFLLLSLVSLILPAMGFAKVEIEEGAIGRKIASAPRKDLQQVLRCSNASGGHGADVWVDVTENSLIMTIEHSRDGSVLFLDSNVSAVAALRAGKAVTFSAVETPSSKGRKDLASVRLTGGGHAVLKIESYNSKREYACDYLPLFQGD